MNLNNNKVLFIVHSYSNFQKDSINGVCNHFKNCSVLVRSNPISEVANYISIPYLNRFKLDCKIDLIDLPSNMEVHPTPIFYAPTDSQYKKLGEKHLRSVEKAIDRNNIEFDVIHSHFTWSAGYVGAKLKEKYDIPFIVTAHGYDIYDLPFRDKEWKDRIEYVLNAADCIITVSNSNLECIKKLNVDTPVRVIPNGFNDKMFHPMDSHDCRKNLNLPFDKKIILTVSNLVEVKGHKYLIEAMSEIVKHRKDVLCLIVGGGQLERKLGKQIRSAGLQDYVKLVGGKPHNEIPTWMNACDVFVLPSLRESFGVVQIEAMACGKPVVATRNGGSEEIVLSEDYGFLAEPGDSQDLAEKIEMALDIIWDENKIINYAEQYQWENITDQIQQIYSSIL